MGSPIFLKNLPLSTHSPTTCLSIGCAPFETMSHCSYSGCRFLLCLCPFASGLVAGVWPLVSLHSVSLGVCTGTAVPALLHSCGCAPSACWHLVCWYADSLCLAQLALKVKLIIHGQHLGHWLVQIPRPPSYCQSCRCYQQSSLPLGDRSLAFCLDSFSLFHFFVCVCMCLHMCGHMYVVHTHV